MERAVEVNDEARPRIGTAQRDDLRISMEVQTEFEQHRLDSFFTKEPETMRWIDELIRPGETFYDVGANVGVYTLYAALRHGGTVQVRAFEPAFHNYHRLCRNLALNEVRQVLAYCMALGDRCSSRTLQLVSEESGSASHAFAGGGSQRTSTSIAFEQGCLTLPLDTLLESFGFPTPQHVKVDIDGYEEAFVAGARATLANPQLRSVLVEVTDERGSKDRILQAMSQAGLRGDHPLNSATEHSRVRRRESGNAKIENLIFVR
jgi:FkbM family methyltransferase